MSKECIICGMFDVDEPKFEMRSKKGVNVHYFCLLLTNGLSQRGDKRNAVDLFLPIDIRDAAKEAKQFTCIFCDKNSASIGCTFPECKTRFHLICGFNNFCLFEFENTFSSKCQIHHGIIDANSHMEDDECYICFQPMGLYNPLTSIFSKCCKLGFFHRNCLIEYANSAGYFLKCLMCGSADFRNDVRRRGVFVPNRDANWELEKGAYASIYFDHKFCDISNCLCPFGRKYINTGKWKMFKCIHCASTGTHKACYIFDNKKGYECFQCRKIVNKSDFKISEVNLNETLDEQTNIGNSIYSEKLVALRETFHQFKLNGTVDVGADVMSETISESSSIPEMEKNIVIEYSDEEEVDPIIIRRKRKIDENNMRCFMLSKFFNDEEV